MLIVILPQVNKHHFFSLIFPKLHELRVQFRIPLQKHFDIGKGVIINVPFFSVKNILACGLNRRAVCRTAHGRTGCNVTCKK